MVLGLGTGTTAALFVAALGRRVQQEGLRISGIPTSKHTADLARSLNIPLTTFAEHTEIDLTVDGADEVELGTLFLIKGHGGALLREKIVAAASKRMVVIADETKLVEHLGKQYRAGGSGAVRLAGDGQQTEKTRRENLDEAHRVRAIR